MGEEQKAISLTARRESVFAAMQRLYDFIQSSSKSNLDAASVRYERLEDLYKEFMFIQHQLIELNVRLKEPVEVEKVTLVFEDLFFGAKLKFRKLQADSTVAAPSQACDVRLPKIVIPPFNGDVETWRTFSDLYASCVHDSQMPAICKFQYLRSLLRGEALRIVENFPLTEENYLLAYEALKKRFQNERLLGGHYLNKYLNYSVVSLDSKEKLQRFLSCHRDSYDAFTALQITNKYDFVLFHIAYNHLDKRLQSSFDNTTSPTDIPTLKALLAHVEDQLKYAELHSISSDKEKTRLPKTHTFLAQVESAAPDTKLCSLCKGNHSLYQCAAFKKKAVQERLEFAQQRNLCFNCLGSHYKSDCQSASRCRICSGFHHSLLHDGSRSSTPPPERHLTSLTAQARATSEVLLGTVQLLMFDVTHQLQPVRAVLDSGSQVSIMTRSCAKRLGLRIHQRLGSVLGLENSPQRTGGYVNTTAVSRLQPQWQLSFEAVVLPSLGHLLPAVELKESITEKFKGLDLADPNFHTPGRIDVILGADVFCAVLSDAPDAFRPGTPSALNTAFGWVIVGKTDQTAIYPSMSLFIRCPPLDVLVRKFWELEEVDPALPLNPDDVACEELFVRTTLRSKSGKYIVALPQKPRCPPLGNNRDRSLRNFLQLERRLQKTPSKYHEYIRFMQDYLDQRHMVEAQSYSDYIIPQHVVMKEASSSTKLRTVFNASATDSYGKSLNERLFPGPKLQASLDAILINFRCFKYAISADLKQMYRQILLRAEDQEKQHIFWRSDTKNPIREYQLTTVTYGMTPSAFLAQRVLKRLVEDDGAGFPRASQAILHERYVDDFITGANTLEEAHILHRELTTLLGRGGFELRKWSSNSLQILNSIPQEHHEAPLVLNDDSEVIKLLGLLWDPKSDVFRYRIQPFRETSTKRNILSYIARTFDPLGFLAPVIFWVKHFLQELWLIHLEWDSPVTGHLLESWKKFTNELPTLEQLRIPRYVPSNNADITLAGFSDASERGYAACLYLLIRSASGVSCQLVHSKTKVAPLKRLSIPRLELQGAVLLTDLVDVFCTRKPNFVTRIRLFTDSTIVLAWLKLEPYKLNTFVANRVAKIQEKFPSTIWHHVNSADNPADAPSRGMFPSEFLERQQLWLEGPVLLRCDEFTPQSVPLSGEIPELKSSASVVLTTGVLVNFFISWTLRFSSLGRLLRIMSYVRRFAVRSSSIRPGPPTLKEQEEALLHLIRLHQEQSFSTDLSRLRRQQSPSKALQALSAFLHDGLLRVGGRIKHSGLSPSAKRPILLPKRCHLARLVVEDTHRISGHSGHALVQALVQHKFWIFGLRSLVRKVSRACVRCTRLNARAVQPAMGDLPAARVHVSRPFSTAATDFAGPFWVREGRRRSSPRTKGYLCVFVCFATKAVHLEFVSALTADAFIAALERFVSRRGVPDEIHSDNGTNYVGAYNQLSEIYAQLAKDADRITAACAVRRIRWRFQPPHAPHFGGLHEAAVKSAKRILLKLVGDQALFFEEFCTLFARIEAIMNSRPLCCIPDDPSEVDYLSPGHFLIGSPLLAVPELSIHENVTLRCRWQRLRQMTQAFWRRWSGEYLQMLNTRVKWQKRTGNLAVDQIVLVPQTTSPLQWPLGRIIAVHPGADGVVRVARVRVGNSILTRPANKLVPIPTEDRLN